MRMKSAIKFIIAKTCRFLCKLGVMKPSKVVLVEGGICSQIRQYYLGVSILPSCQPDFDMSFYLDGGRDMLGNYNRPFELLTIFPDLTFKQCDERKARFYRRWLQEDDKENLSLPLYINYYKLTCDYGDFKNVFALEKAVLPGRLNSLLDMIKNSQSCGVHIRRGDLANNNNSYYGEFSEDYIMQAMDYVEKRNGGEVNYFVFSDDPQWVKKEFSLRCEYPIFVVEGNSGSEDLILLAHCRYIISSQGSAGRMAALLNGDSLLIMKKGDPHNASYLKAHNNCVEL